MRHATEKSSPALVMFLILKKIGATWDLIVFFFMALIVIKYIYNLKRIMILEGRRLNGEN